MTTIRCSRVSAFVCAELFRRLLLQQQSTAVVMLQFDGGGSSPFGLSDSPNMSCGDVLSIYDPLSSADFILSSFLTPT